MKEFKIKLDTIQKVRHFVNYIAVFDNEIDIVSSRYVEDAKSIMGIFSLDLSKSLCVRIQGESNLKEISKVLKSYLE